MKPTRTWRALYGLAVTLTAQAAPSRPNEVEATLLREPLVYSVDSRIGLARALRGRSAVATDILTRAWSAIPQISDSNTRHVMEVALLEELAVHDSSKAEEWALVLPLVTHNGYRARDAAVEAILRSLPPGRRDRIVQTALIAGCFRVEAFRSELRKQPKAAAQYVATLSVVLDNFPRHGARFADIVFLINVLRDANGRGAALYGSAIRRAVDSIASLRSSTSEQEVVSARFAHGRQKAVIVKGTEVFAIQLGGIAQRWAPDTYSYVRRVADTLADTWSYKDTIPIDVTFSLQTRTTTRDREDSFATERRFIVNSDPAQRIPLARALPTADHRAPMLSELARLPGYGPRLRAELLADSLSAIRAMSPGQRQIDTAVAVTQSAAGMDSALRAKAVMVLSDSLKALCQGDAVGRSQGYLRCIAVYNDVAGRLALAGITDHLGISDVSLANRLRTAVLAASLVRGEL